MTGLPLRLRGGLDGQQLRGSSTALHRPPDLGSDTYLEKLKGQLAGASDPAIRLMAELHYVYLLLPHTMSGGNKREILGTISGSCVSPPLFLRRSQTLSITAS